MNSRVNLMKRLPEAAIICIYTIPTALSVCFNLLVTDEPGATGALAMLALIAHMTAYIITRRCNLRTVAVFSTVLWGINLFSYIGFCIYNYACGDIISTPISLLLTFEIYSVTAINNMIGLTSAAANIIPLIFICSLFFVLNLLQLRRHS